MPRHNVGTKDIAGYVVIDDPDEGVREYDTYQCCHCGAHYEREVGKGPPAMCLNCMQPTCGEKRCDPCIPQEAWLEAMEGTREFYHGQEILPNGMFVPRSQQQAREAEIANGATELIVARS